jgi:hypothetical protein
MSSDKVKNWILKNPERWKEIQKKSYLKRMEKKEYREKRTDATKKLRNKKIENDPNFKELEKDYSTIYYYENYELASKKRHSNYYFKKLWKNKDNYETDEEMLIQECKGLKDDDLFIYICENYMDAFNKFLKR